MGWTVEGAWWGQCLTPSCCLACALARVLSFPDESSYPAIGLISACSGRGVRWPSILPTSDRVLRIKYENPDIFILEHMIAKGNPFRNLFVGNRAEVLYTRYARHATPRWLIVKFD
jgi:hypothetical protein